MKILYVANARIPTEKAHGIQIMKMCEAFIKVGNEVELIVPRRFNWIKKDPFDYYGVERVFKIKKLPCLDLITLTKYIGHLGFWAESLTFFFFLFFYLIFRKTDLIYTRDRFFLPFGLIKRNIIFEAHAFPGNYFLYSPFLKRLKGIVVITQKLKDLFAEKGIALEKILVAPDGVDLKMFECSNMRIFEAREKLGLPKDKKIILYTGHLYQWKGAQTLAEASPYLPKDADIYFVGGTLQDIKEFKIQNSKFKIQVMGHRPHEEIPYWLKAADVLVLPNSAKEDISKYWTSPIKMFEYMASKKPIVASDLPSIREILSGDNAVLVTPDDPKNLAEGVKKALVNRELVDRISHQAFRDVQAYSWQKRAVKILQFINEKI